jgi:hypothetical protein
MTLITFQDVVATGRGVQKRVRSDLVLRNEPECGITKHRQFSKRIIGGEKAKFAELPWQVREQSPVLKTVELRRSSKFEHSPT